MSIVLAHQPHFANQPAGVQVFWGYGLFPDRIGNFVAKAMADCTGAEVLQELCGHLRFDLETVASANCIPCRMPYITSMFMPRALGDRPLPVPPDTKNFAFISQFVEIPQDPCSSWPPCSRSSSRCGPRRWRCISFWASPSRFLRSRRTTNRCTLDSTRWSRP